MILVGPIEPLCEPIRCAGIGARAPLDLSACECWRRQPCTNSASLKKWSALSGKPLVTVPRDDPDRPRLRAGSRDRCPGHGLRASVVLCRHAQAACDILVAWCLGVQALQVGPLSAAPRVLRPRRRAF